MTSIMSLHRMTKRVRFKFLDQLYNLWAETLNRYEFNDVYRSWLCLHTSGVKTDVEGHKLHKMPDSYSPLFDFKLIVLYINVHV